MKIYTPAKKGMDIGIKKIGSNLFSGSKDITHIDMLKLLAQAAHEHSWTFATVDAISRSVVGSGWSIVPVERYANDQSKRKRKAVEDFFEYRERSWDNIKDFQSLPDKLAQTVGSYRLFGHAAWEMVRDGNNDPIGFDVLSGIVIPQVDESGYFENPAFLFYPWGAGDPIEYQVDEIAYFYNSGITGKITGESPYSTLANTTIPSDLFAAVSYRSLFENVNAPYNGLWQIDPSVSDDDFDFFLALLEERYSGATNFGRNPLVIRGGADFKQVKSRNTEDAPYLDGRSFNREEFFGVTGVDGNKLGITSSANKANIRETRREFHENILRPLFRKLEDDIYYQVIVRMLDARGWKFQFKQPDITNAVEQASIDMRMLQWGIYSPNEIRKHRGEDPRTDGDYYYAPMNMVQMTDGEMVSPTGDKTENDNPGQTEPDETEPSEPERVPRDEDTSVSNMAISDLRLWRRLHLQYLDGKREKKEFKSDYIDQEVLQEVQRQLIDVGKDFQEVKGIFDRAIKAYEEND